MTAANIDAEAWIDRLKLERHPEGGWFRRIYTGPPLGSDGRPAATSIYYLLDSGEPRGRLHVNRSDILHFLIDGGPADYLVCDPAGSMVRMRMGPALDMQRFLLVPGGSWKAMELVNSASYALVTEVVTPGFEWADHAFVSEADIRNRCPQHLPELQRFLGPV